MSHSSLAPVPGDDLSLTRLVSVIIPCYNQAHFLDEAIESVLAQTYEPLEIILIDDGSSDNTPEVAQRYPQVRYFHQENAGRSRARNAGLGKCHGEFVAFLDADDRLLPDALATGIASMREHPECAFVSGRCQVINAEGAVLPSPRQRHVEREHYLELLRGGNYIWCPATVLYRRQIFDFVHGFDPVLVPVEDYELYLGITRDFQVFCHYNLIAEYRQHHSNTSRDSSPMQRAAIAAHRKHWDFTKAHRRYRQAFERGARFWREVYPEQQLVDRIREIVREQLPADAIVSVASGGKAELLRLGGRQARHFPEQANPGPGNVFAEASQGSHSTDPWIEAGITYAFSLHGGANLAKMLARIFVRGLPASATNPGQSVVERETTKHNGILLEANPNPVPVGEHPGKTTITWNTGDGSNGRVYVSAVGIYAGGDPADSAEAQRLLETARAHGTQFLLIPARSFYWRDQFEAFREYVETRYDTIVLAEDICVIFDLREEESA